MDHSQDVGKDPSVMVPTQEPPLTARADQDTGQRAHSLRWIVLAVIGVTQLMVVLDGTVVNIALPAAQADLGFSTGDRQWVVTAYALAFGSLLLLGGRLGDIIGRRTAFLVGLTGFALASVVGGSAANFTMLITARVVQGVFGALLAPAALAILSTTFTDKAERGRAFGVFGAISGASGAVGLLVGGALTEWASWRWCLYVNLIFAAIALIGGLLVVPKSLRERNVRLDLPGTATVTAGLFCIVYGLSSAAGAGWSAASTLGWLIGGLILLAAFVLLERRVPEPLLPLRVIWDRNRGGSFLALLISGTGIFAIFLFLTYFLQDTLGYTPILTGLAFLPMLLVLAIVANLATAVALPRFGPRPLIPTGMAITAVGMALLTQITQDSSYVPNILPGLVLAGVGIGLIISPSTEGAVSGLQPGDAGVASATVNTMQQIGGSLGAALLSSIFAGGAASYLAGRTRTASVVAQSAVEGYIAVYGWAVVIFAAGAAITALLLRRKARDVSSHEPDLAS